MKSVRSETWVRKKQKLCVCNANIFIIYDDLSYKEEVGKNVSNYK